MTKYILLLLSVIIISPLSKSQNKINMNIGYGYFIVNSENSLRIMTDQKYHPYINYGIIYQRDNIWGYNIKIEYDYSKVIKDNVITFYRTGLDSPTIIGSFGGDMTLINHNIDLDYVGRISDYFDYGFGPSFVITNRILSIEGYLYDKLASSGLGANVFIDANIPLSNEDDYFFLTSSLKFRYTHSIWFDKGIRDLDNYYQQFVTGQIQLGIGYAFN